MRGAAQTVGARLLAGPLLAALIALASLVPGGAWADDVARAEITPHRGIYKLELLRAQSSSGIIGAQGTAYFEWAKACEGYLVNQHVRMRLSLAEGLASVALLTFSSLESVDGTKMSFHLRQIADGVLTEEIEGEVELHEAGGTARLTSPEPKEIALPSGTLLPTDYTQRSLAAMIGGAPLFSGTLFDGSSADGAYHVSTFFGSRADRPVPGGAPGEEEPFWNSRAGYFQAGTDDAEPLFEVGALINAGGVAAWFDLDYGSFSVRALLSDFERLPDPIC